MYGNAVSREVRTSRDTALRIGVYLVARAHGTAACFQTLLRYITGNQILLTSLFLHTVPKAVLRLMYPASTGCRKQATYVNSQPRVLEATPVVSAFCQRVDTLPIRQADKRQRRRHNWMWRYIGRGLR